MNHRLSRGFEIYYTFRCCGYNNCIPPKNPLNGIYFQKTYLLLHSLKSIHIHLCPFSEIWRQALPRKKQANNSEWILVNASKVMLSHKNYRRCCCVFCIESTQSTWQKKNNNLFDGKGTCIFCVEFTFAWYEIHCLEFWAEGNHRVMFSKSLTAQHGVHWPCRFCFTRKNCLIMCLQPYIVHQISQCWFSWSWVLFSFISSRWFKITSNYYWFSS